MPEVSYAWESPTREVMRFRHRGRALACSAICPHMGARLALEGDGITCPWHGLTFRLPDGASGHPRYPRLAIESA